MIDWRKGSIRRYYVDRFFLLQAEKLRRGQLVIDLGGHKGAKRGQFDIDHYGLKVITLNITAKKGADLLSDAKQAGLADQCTEVIFCGEVLEHVFRPDLVVHEVFRLLRPGGVFCATVPFLYHMHADPYDYGRYTDYYWHQVLEEAGFAEIEIIHQGYFWSVIAGQLEQYLKQSKRWGKFGGALRAGIRICVIRPLRRYAIWKEQGNHKDDSRVMTNFTTGFEIVALKSL